MSTADGDNPVSAEPAPEPSRPLVRAKRVAQQSPPEPIRAKRIEPETPAPEVEIPTPGVVNCFRVFCMIVAFGAVIGAGCSFIPLTNDYSYYNDGSAECVGFLLLSFTVFTVFGIPLFFPRAKPWMWWYGLTLILLATLSLYLTIFGVLLLIFWVQPRAQRYFGRMVEVKIVDTRRRNDYDDDDIDDEPMPRRRYR